MGSEARRPSEARRRLEVVSEGGSGGSPEEAPRGFRARLAREIRRHPFGYSVLGIFLVAGPLLTPLVFPQAPPAVAIVGGLAFGAYAALCAVPQKFI